MPPDSDKNWAGSDATNQFAHNDEIPEFTLQQKGCGTAFETRIRSATNAKTGFGSASGRFQESRRRRDEIARSLRMFVTRRIPRSWVVSCLSVR